MLKMPISDHFRKISAIIAQTAQSGLYIKKTTNNY